MGMKEIMGTLSPVYGMATGKGMFGNAVGLLPAIAKDMRDDKAEEKKKAAMAAQTGAPAQPGMKKGGSVSSASKRADGIAVKGKTRGKMV
jgi:hypothetical protein